MPIGTIPLSGFDSEIFSPKLRKRLLRDDVINDVIRPGSTIREDHIDTIQINIVLKFRLIPTRIAGEDAF